MRNGKDYYKDLLQVNKMQQHWCVESGGGPTEKGFGF